MRILRLLTRLLMVLTVLAGGTITVLYFHRPGMDAYAAHLAPPAKPGAAHALTASWFGTTAALLSDGEHAVMVDPFFTRPEGFPNLIRNREIAPDEAVIAHWLTQAGIKHLDAVLVSHSHYDHAMDAGVVARLTGATLLGSASTANIGRGNGLAETQIRVIKASEVMQYGPFKITFIESKHAGATGGKPTGDITEVLAPPAHYLDYKQGGTYSILIEHLRGTVLHHGSAGFVPGALKNYHADTVFLGIALRGDMQTYLSEVVDAVGAHRVIPTHWDDFTRPLDQPLQPFPVALKFDQFFDDMARLRPDVQVQTLAVGVPVVLFE